MKTLLKLIGGLAIGAAIGTGIYLLLSRNEEEGVVHDVKMLVNDAIEEGKRAAESRREQLQVELGQHSSPSGIAVTPPAANGGTVSL